LDRLLDPRAADPQRIQRRAARSPKPVQHQLQQVTRQAIFQQERAYNNLNARALCLKALMASVAKKRRRAVLRFQQRRVFLRERLCKKPSPQAAQRAGRRAADEKAHENSTKPRSSALTTTFDALNDALNLIQEAQRATQVTLNGAASAARAASRGSELGWRVGTRGTVPVRSSEHDARASLDPIQALMNSERFRVDPFRALTETLQTRD